ncbi:MAG: hypothetical protein ABSA12_14925 [Verrucomicrobiia bacterium]
MPDKAQLIAQIRFALERLSERNAEHEWEELCRHLSRERICANILPATGPVQAGGDQGRDFETFRTFLQQSSLGQRSFVGLISDKPIAFACTIEKEKGIASKIRDDITTIMSSGTRPETIYEFCACGVKVAKRHELQEWAQTKHSVHLEIMDGAAVAELLCDRELLWLVERYLQLPSELLPSLTTAEEEKDWYTSKLEKWKQEKCPPQTFAHFLEIRSAGRTALGPFKYDKDGAPVSGHDLPELPFWIERLDEITSKGAVQSLRRRAFYEATVLRLRGLGSLIGQEERLRGYFSYLTQLQDLSEIEDFQVLLTYVVVANRLGHVRLQDAELKNWVQALEDRLVDRLHNAKKHEKINEWCALLDIRAHLALFLRIAWKQPDATEALQYWGKLVKLVNRAPLFPLERFADRLAEYARYIGRHPLYEPLTKKVDALVAKRFGNFKAAEKCLDRAIAFRDADDLPRAMAQLHRAKIDWFAEETLGKSLQVLGWLSGAYQEQGLCFAAKYYALAAAFSAVHSQDLKLKPMVSRNLERAASCDYSVGAWHGLLELAAICVKLYPHFASDPESDFTSADGSMFRLPFHLAMAAAATKLLFSDLEAYATTQTTQIMKSLGLDDVLQQTRDHALKVWANNAQDLWTAIEEQLNGPPWSDSGPMRYVRWKAHGVTWNVQWCNDYESTLAAEEFLAVLQIFLSDLAGQDLCLLRSSLSISIRLASDDAFATAKSGGHNGFDVRFEPSNTERVGVVTLPPYRRFYDGTITREDLQAGALGVAGSLLTEISLLPLDRFGKILEERLKEGLQTKLLIAATYGRCHREFISQEDFESSGRYTHASLPKSVRFAPRLPDELPWFNGPGPGYDSREAKKLIRNRYSRFPPPIARTLERLKRELPFRMTLDRLRATGWKDWHILSAVFHVTMNYRLNHIRRTQGVGPEQATSLLMPHKPEPEDALPVPLEEYEEKNMRAQFQMFVISFAKTYKLELHSPTPNFSEIEDFLAQRYNFWTDDVDHEDPFAL